jgi:hypothetical protein
MAAGMAKGEQIVFLDPRTIVTWGWLEPLLRRLNSDPSIGIVTPASSRAEPLRCCLMSRKVWEQGGELDEEFLLRIDRAGHHMAAVEDSLILQSGEPHSGADRILRDRAIAASVSPRREESSGGS